MSQTRCVSPQAAIRRTVTEIYSVLSGSAICSWPRSKHTSWLKLDDLECWLRGQATPES